jgi:DNA-binding transcriptional LysR family regulator
MEWQQLKGFHATARLGSITKAAEATLRTQSAVSQQIKALEEELGVKLIQRLGRKKLALTPAGERLQEFCALVLQEEERLQHDLAEMKGQPRGRLRLAAPFTTLYQLLPDYVRDYLGKSPNVELSILDRSQDEVIDLLRQGEADIGFALETAVPPDLAKQRWKKVVTRVMAPKGHPLAKLKKVGLRKVAEHPLILPPSGLGRQRLEEHLNRLGMEYRVVMESANVELSALYVEQGLGVSFATVIQGAPWLEHRNLAFIPLDKGFPPDYLSIITRKGQKLLPAQTAFIHGLKRKQQLARGKKISGE